MVQERLRLEGVGGSREFIRRGMVLDFLISENLRSSLPIAILSCRRLEERGS